MELNGHSGVFEFIHHIPAAKDFLRETSIPAGTYVFMEGQHCQQIALVTKGCIRVSKISNTGREITLYRVNRGESCILMLSSALSGKGYPATAIVEEDVHALLIPLEKFKELMKTTEELSQFVFGLLTNRLTSVMALVEEITFRKMDQRLAEFILHRTVKTTMLEITHDEIALELGTAREVISRLLKDMEKTELIKLSRGKILVTDPSGLKKIIHS